MKKLNLALAAVAALAMASCSSDEPAVNASNDGHVSFHVSLPATTTQSRAFSDGQQAKQLKYALYDYNQTANTYTLADSATVTPNWVLQSDKTLDAQVIIDMAVGKTYKVVFFASAPASSQTFTTVTFGANAATLDVDYSKVTENSEVYDAFYQAIDVNVTSTYTGEDVVLYRPFAQLNVGSNDTQKPVVKAAYPNNVNTKVTVSSLATQMNLITNQVVTPTTAVAHTFGPVEEAANEAFPITGTPTYSWLAMNYLLVQDASDYTVDLEFLNGPTASVRTMQVPNVPLQRNYQTNIYGQLLSASPTFNVKIQPAFNQPSLTPAITVANQTDLTNALAKSDLNINIALAANADVTLPALKGKESVTISGPASATLNLASNTNIKGCNLTIDGVSVKTPATYFSGNRDIFYGSNSELTIKNSAIDGTGIFLDDLKKATIDNCVWTFSAQNLSTQSIHINSATDVTFKNSTFNTQGSYAIEFYPVLSSYDSLVYNVVVEGCTFNNLGTNTYPAAILIQSAGGLPVCTMTLDSNTISGFTKLWGMEGTYSNMTITVNGVKEWPNN